MRKNKVGIFTGGAGSYLRLSIPKHFLKVADKMVVEFILPARDTIIEVDETGFSS